MSIAQTSRTAHAEAVPAARARQIPAILALLADGQDRTIAEIAAALGMRESSISGRVNELLSIGRLVAKPERLDKITGRQNRPVSLLLLSNGAGAQTQHAPGGDSPLRPGAAPVSVQRGDPISSCSDCGREHVYNYRCVRCCIRWLLTLDEHARDAGIARIEAAGGPADQIRAIRKSRRSLA